MPALQPLPVEGQRYRHVDDLPCFDGVLDNVVVIDEAGFAAELLAWANEISAPPTPSVESEGEAN